MTDQPNVAEKVNGVEPMITVEKNADVELVATLDEDKPTFDFGELSYADVRQLEKTYNRATRLAEKKNAPNLTDEQMEALEVQAEGLMDDVYDSVALSITYIPRSWLVKRAPVDVDVTEKGILRKYLRADRIMDLVEEFKASQEKKV